MSSPRPRSAERDWRRYQAALVLSDVACFLAGPGAAAWLSAQRAMGSHPSDRYLQLAVLIAPVYLLIFLSQGLYDPRNLLGGTREYSAVFRACVYGLAAVILIDFLLRRDFSRQWIVLSAVLTTCLVGGARFSLRRLARRLRRRGHFTKRALVVGADADGLAVAAKLGEPNSGIQVVGVLDDYAPAGTVLGQGLRVLGSPASLAQVAAREEAQEAIVVPQALPWETLHKVLATVAFARDGLRVHLAAGFYDLLATGVVLSELNRVPLVTINKARLTGAESAFKLALDYLLAIVLLLLFSPLLLLAACWLWLSGSGHVLERRQVLGRGGRPFTLFSFRSAPPVGGDLVRKLPGLANVLLGQLSLVGPRPVLTEHASADMEQTMTLTIRPGLTGPWRQVEDARDQALLDLFYIRSYSIWLDLHVLLARVISRVRPGSRAAVVGMRAVPEQSLQQMTRMQ